MMNKILLEIYLPAGGCSYDVFVPRTSRLYEIVGLLSHAFSELSGGYYAAADNAVLCDRATGMIYNINLSVGELELGNGARLMLI